MDTCYSGSGQRINMQKKSLVFFGEHCTEEILLRAMDVLGVQLENLQSTYIGMPTCFGKSSSGFLNFIADRLWKRIRGWSDRPLSSVGKEVMLKSVIQAIPTYIMSCFQLPATI